MAGRGWRDDRRDQARSRGTEAGRDYRSQRRHLDPPACKECADNVSALSRFAYFIYLVRKTGKTLVELDARLHQRFRTLTPDSGQDELAQIELCVEILARALSRDLRDGEEMKPRRYVIARMLLLLPVGLHDLAVKVHASHPSIGVASLEAKLRELLSAAPDADAPSFTTTQLEAVETAIDELLLASFVAQAQTEPRYAGGSNDAIQAEAALRVDRAKASARIGAMPLWREAYQAALGKTDAQLFSSFLVETNLGVCERTTRLDQAIRSLQAYLDQARARLEAAGEPGDRLAYLEFDAWRSEESARLYPELKALWQDDVLAFEAVPGDRGSILSNHVVNQPKLAAAVDAARRIVKDCDAVVQGGSVQGGSAASFASRYTTFFGDFERGFDVLTSILDANAQVRSALSQLDAHEPALAISHLSSAAETLAHIANLVFMTGSPWRAPEAGLALYDRIAAMPIADRKQLLQALFDELKEERKSIFVPQNASFVVAGLSPGGAFQSLASGWTAHDSYARSDDGSVHKRSASGSSIMQARYGGAGSADLTNYTCSVECSLPDPLVDGDKLGLAIRSDAAGQKSYRLLIEREVTSTDPDEGEFFDSVSDFLVGEDEQFIVNTYLRLLHDQGSNSIKLQEKKIRPSGGVSVGSEFLPAGETFTLSLQAYGSTVTGVLTLGGDEFRVSADDGSQPRGTFALMASGGVDVDFSNLRVDVEGSDGRPPFYAPRRVTRDQSVSVAKYGRHRSLRRGMASRSPGEARASRQRPTCGSTCKVRRSTTSNCSSGSRTSSRRLTSTCSTRCWSACCRPPSTCATR